MPMHLGLSCAPWTPASGAVYAGRAVKIVGLLMSTGWAYYAISRGPEPLFPVMRPAFRPEDLQIH